MLDFKNDIAEIDGWLTKAEGVFLYKTAKAVSSENVIVEIGSWKGKSTICLGKGVLNGNNAEIYAIDPHVDSFEHHKFGEADTYQEFTQNIKNAEVEQYIKPIRKTSESASRNFHEPVGLLFVDGAHKFKFVQSDIESWFSKVEDSGIIAFHDTRSFFPLGPAGPSLATAILLLTSSQIKNPKLIDTITYCEKVKKNSFLDRAKNILFLFYRTLFGWIGAIEPSKRVMFK